MTNLPSCDLTLSEVDKAANASNNSYAIRRSPPSSEGGSFKAVKESYRYFSKRYLFSEIEARVAKRDKSRYPDLINLGVGDISLPLVGAAKQALIQAAEEMAEKPIGYGPTDGYPFLKKAILESEYPFYNFQEDEIAITDGIGSSITTFASLFPEDYTIGIIDPAYPAYYDATRLDNRKKITFLPCLEENSFLPLPPQEKIDIVYLCSPHNPTGGTFSRAQLQAWIDWARKHNALIFFDAAYHAFIQNPGVPKTIYEIPGAKEVALEFRSFSKAAGFTGLRLGYLMLPKELSLSSFWRLRQDVYSNGFAYPVQKAACAVLSEEGKKECLSQIHIYLQGAKKMKELLLGKGFSVYGGENIPFLWWKINTKDSWQAFDILLSDYGIISAPGIGFGPSGEGYIRLSTFLSLDKQEKALTRLLTLKPGAL